MLSNEKCLEKCQGYLPEFHPTVYECVLVADEAAQSAYWNLLAEHVRKSRPDLSDEDGFNLLGVFGFDDAPFNGAARAGSPQQLKN
jgi:hypothetical protein